MHSKMSSPRKSSAVDPDYEMTEIARERVRLKEDRENKEKAEKIVEIINREFQMELDHRQSQLELIQQRLNEAQKTLHLLRYVIITSYYGDNNVPNNQTEEKMDVKGESSISNKSRIHPTIKALLGSNVNDYKFNYTKQPRKKIKLVDNQKDIIEKDKKPRTSESSDLSNQTMEWEETSDQLGNNDIERKSLDNEIKEEELDTSRNRKKGKYRIVVGNISKWMPSKSEEDKSTHKWMVYVRGSKESPDITHFVQKVVFYLHPSYQPNDVIELREAPFHLSRRGWGEFPIRVRIFFQCSLNKPVDIIHNLKLDKTFSGRQTLGNETLVNLFLYEDEKKMLSRMKTCVSDDQLMIKKEYNTDEAENLKIEIDFQNITQEHAMPNLEHDYCFVGSKEKIKKEVSENASLPTTSVQIQHTYNCLTEHSYCVSNSSQYLCKSVDVNLDQQETDLIYGLGEMEHKNEIIEETVIDDIKFPVKKHTQNGLQRFIISNGTVIAIKKRRKPQESLLKKMFHKKYHLNGTEMVSLLQNTQHQNSVTEKVIDSLPAIDYNKYSIDFPSHKFKSVQEALPYLFKRLPIISNLATDINYKCTYPYVAKSLEEYSSWNIGKRLSAEWFRAKTILNIITAAQLSNSKNLTVKSVIMYGRSHGYTPLSNYNIFKNKGALSVHGINTPPNTFTTSSKQKIPKLQEPDVLIDVINCIPDSEHLSNPLHKEKFIDDKLELTNSYVKQAVLDIGIILKPENIIPGVLFNAAERVLLQGALCLAENLLRSARANLVCQGNFQEETSIIGSEEILQVLRERPEFKALLKSCTTN